MRLVHHGTGVFELYLISDIMWLAQCCGQCSQYSGCKILDLGVLHVIHIYIFIYEDDRQTIGFSEL